MYSGKVFKIKINDIKDMKENEERFKEFIKQFGPIIGSAVAPIHLNGFAEDLMLERSARIDDQEIFKAIVNGYRIDLSVTKGDE